MARAKAAITLPTLLCGLACAVSACARSMPDPGVPLTPPTALCVREPVSQECRRASEVEAWFREPELEIISSADTPAGRQGARVLTLAVPHGEGRVVFRAKWRSHATISTINEPRKELAAHALQRLFLSPEQFVVPPSAGHCFELEHYRRRVEPDAKPTFRRTPCVFGILSYWLEGAKGIDDAEDAGWIPSDELLNVALFRDDLDYRRSLANVNLLAYLISHGDSHPKQFVFTRHFDQLRAYVVDNSLAFSSYRNPSLKGRHVWSKILVPALSRSSIESLRALTPATLSALVVAEQYREHDGRLLHTAPDPPGGRTDQGMRWAGQDLQIGLTEAEAKLVWERMQALLARVERGEIRLFALDAPDEAATRAADRRASRSETQSSGWPTPARRL